ncbi:sugar phosphate isomerase/epimerase [Murinocardiopsis flavida]|uniref:Sugar phosphate isomerase/epimerase n=1 Tax=Murinocardiopsis flavida TaxID=645275 RepID=A0A2P8DLF5_9ACTN|nr:sugar phosphate isomerase/epimerase family protein [Murinocardiopsis flavida]PSK98050.1 sugar phosphate isomerase/epimerase [Murinocardiopsis flavida]
MPTTPDHPGARTPRAAPLRIGYGSNGFTDHRLHEALTVLADLGYDGVAVTPDTGHLDPYEPGLPVRVDALAAHADRLGLALTVETGARYVIDPHRKHAPTLLDADPAPRLDYLRRCLRIAAGLGAPTMALWSGAAPPGLAPAAVWDRLVRATEELLDDAARHGVALGFEPEPGMFVDTIAGYERLRDLLGAPAGFGICLDLGHCVCTESAAVPDCVARVAADLVAVQIEDMRRGVHEHREFGTGDIDFPPVLAALAAAGYTGLVGIELPRHAHAAPAVAARSLAFLRRAEHAARVPEEAR